MREAAVIAHAVGRQFLTFTLNERRYGVPAELVREVVHTPVLARVPQAPKGLLGLGNLRGQVTPVASVRALLQQAPDALELSGLTLVVEAATPTAIAIGAAPALTSAENVQTAAAERPGERLLGVFQDAAVGPVHILDLEALLARAFVPREGAVRGARAGAVAPAHIGRNDSQDDARVICFSVAGQEFALDLDVVREVILTPDVIAPSPKSEALVLGVAAYRDGLLPLLSLRGLLGLEGAAAFGGRRQKVVVTDIGAAKVGLVVDSANAILGLDAALTDPPPALLAARAGGESQIKLVYRGARGARLVSVLDPDALFREDVMQRLTRNAASAVSTEIEEAVIEDRFVVFRLGEDEFALPVAAVTEVTRMPDQITRVPKTPAFLEGVTAYRGEVLPVVDQRRRFDMAPRNEEATRRLIVVRTGAHAAGIIVDTVTEVLSAPRDAMVFAPDLAGEKTRLVEGVLNPGGGERIVMVLDPTELLTRAERSLLDAFQADVQSPT